LKPVRDLTLNRRAAAGMIGAANCPHAAAFGKGGMPVSENYVAVDPYPWPFDGDLCPAW
jgi:hypothetical protein